MAGHAPSARDSTLVRRNENPTGRDGRLATKDATSTRQSGAPAGMVNNPPAASIPQSTTHVQGPDGNYESLCSTIKALEGEVRQLRSEVQTMGDSVGEGAVLHFRQLGAAFLSWLSLKDQKGAAKPDKTLEQHIEDPPKGFESGREPNEDGHDGWAKLRIENQKLHSDSKKLSAKNRDLLSENQKLLSNFENLSAKNKDLFSENRRISTELYQTGVRYQALYDEYTTHRCADSDDFEVSDGEIESKFKELQMTIESLLNDCDIGSLGAAVVQEMGKRCGTAVDLGWWEIMEVEARESWIASLLADALHSEFFETPFFLLDRNQEESGLVDFERLIFDERNGISRQHATEWRARTFRIAEVLSRRTQSLKLQGATGRLLGIFRHILTGRETRGALSEICGLALNCAALLRDSKSRYFWEQRVQPVNATSETATIRRIFETPEYRGPRCNIIFTVFGEVVKESRKDEKKSVILKPLVAISKGYRPTAG